MVSTRERSAVIVTPAAGAWRAGRAVPTLHKALAPRDAEVVLTQRPGQASSDLARKAARDGYTPVAMTSAPELGASLR